MKIIINLLFMKNLKNIFFEWIRQFQANALHKSLKNKLNDLYFPPLEQQQKTRALTYWQKNHNKCIFEVFGALNQSPFISFHSKIQSKENTLWLCSICKQKIASLTLCSTLDTIRPTCSKFNLSFFFYKYFPFFLFKRDLNELSRMVNQFG